MKFLFDQNISYRILKLLPKPFKNSIHIKTEAIVKTLIAHSEEIVEFIHNDTYGCYEIVQLRN